MNSPARKLQEKFLSYKNAKKQTKVNKRNAPFRLQKTAPKIARKRNNRSNRWIDSSQIETACPNDQHGSDTEAIDQMQWLKRDKRWITVNKTSIKSQNKSSNQSINQSNQHNSQTVKLKKQPIEKLLLGKKNKQLETMHKYKQKKEKNAYHVTEKSRMSNTSTSKLVRRKLESHISKLVRR